MKKAITITIGLALVLGVMSYAAPAAFANPGQAAITATNSGTNTGVGGVAGLASTGVNAPVTTAGGTAGNNCNGGAGGNGGAGANGGSGGAGGIGGDVANTGSGGATSVASSVNSGIGNGNLAA